MIVPRYQKQLVTPAIILIVVVAAVLRLNQFRQPFIDAFSWRQTSTAMIASNYYRTDWNIFYPEVDWSGPGPNYQGREFQTVSYITALMYTMLGQHDWIGRLVVISFGLWGIFALYQLIRRVWDEKHAVLGAGVMAVLPGGIFIERSFLPDPAMVALVVTSFWLLVIYLETGKRRFLLIAGVIGAWGFSTKVPGLIVGLPMAYAWWAIAKSKQTTMKRILVDLVIFGSLTLLPVIVYYWWARHLALSYPPYHFAGDGNWLWDDGWLSWWSQGYFWPRLSQRFRDWLWTSPIIALGGLGLLGPLLYQQKHTRVLLDGQTRAWLAPWLFHYWLLAGIMYYMIGAKELVENPWNFHVVAPAASTLAGAGIAMVMTIIVRSIQKVRLWTGERRQSLAAWAAAVAIFLFLIIKGQQALKWMYYPYAGEGYQLGMALREISEPDSLVVTLANDVGDPMAIYYSQRRGWVFPPAQPAQAWGYLLDDDDQNIQLMAELRDQGASWLGVVNEQMVNLESNHLDLFEYIHQNGEVMIEDTDFVIYRFHPWGEG